MFGRSEQRCRWPNGIDFYRLHPKETKCTYFSSGPGAFPNRDHKLDHKTNLNKFLKFSKGEFLSMFSEQNGIKIEVSDSKLSTEFLKYSEINTQWNNPQFKEEITRGIRKYFKDSEKMTSEFLSTLSLKGNVKPYMLILENKKGTKPVIFVYTLKS